MAKLVTRPIRALQISSPNSINTVSSSIKSNIIIVAKYSFQSENETELSINKGDILKLLDRPGSGWILVKFIDKVAKPGLIPASYVDIAVNDPINPITLTWLHEITPDNKTPLSSPNPNNFNDHNYIEWQIKNLLKSNMPVTLNNKPYPVLASIANFLLYEDRYWYRLDICYSDGSQSFICRYYQDFYNLHISLLEFLSHLNSKEVSAESLKLPKLPEPIPLKRLEPKELVNLLLKRCNDLHVYMNRLILNKHYQISTALINWLDVKHDNLPGFQIAKNEKLNFTNDEISHRVLPNSINILKQVKDKQRQDEEDEEEEEKSDLFDENETINYSPNNTTIDSLPKRTKLKNIYNHYQQVMNFESTKKPTPSPVNSTRPLSPKLSINTNVTTPSHMSTASARSMSESSIFSTTPNGSNNRSPDTPLGRDFFNRSNSASRGVPSIIPAPRQHYNPQTPFNSNFQNSNHNYSHNHSPQQQFHHSPPHFYASITPKNMSPRSNSPGFNSPASTGHNSTTPSAYIKCKIMTPSNDILAVKLLKLDIMCMDAFKRLIMKKVYFKYLYIRLPNQVDKTFHNIDTLKFNLVEFVRQNDKVLLRIS